jgi:hypothetical protein
LIHDEKGLTPASTLTLKLILLLILSSKATKEIKASGFKVGLLGGNPKEIEQAMGR